ncbi:MAG: nucleotidyltransferase family protein [Ornithinimicrobium sp.]|uniref:nucleotidyltransferase family protein n=1 Tax=Ornithinimicrobium sp. TaxID=1977084 RepID=UPI003D9ABB03
MSMPSARRGARVTGLLLAAGQGRRMGTPKALVEVEGQPLIQVAVTRMLAGGCADVLVVLGAEAEHVVRRVSPQAERWADRVDSTVCATWAQGMGESLRTGLAALAARGRQCPNVVLVHLVDLPDVTDEVINRVLEEAHGHSTLARAAYQGSPGHPVLLGQSHWQAVMDSATGDRGARAYLRRADPTLVECGDLATGRDVDTPDDLAPHQP